ncbi:MAG TPA: glycosyltransferase family A protein [Bacteroidia bacterium]|nr:glycosyltransferase family A protein [Bacteroidia bacterium]
MKTISVIIAAYRAADFIRSAIDSVLAQQLPDNYRLQLILGIDGCESTKQAVSTIRDERLLVLNMDHNYGTYITFNTMMRFAAGDLIARFDADDIMLEGYLRRQIEILEQHPDVYLTWTRSQYIDPEGRHITDESQDIITAPAYWEIRSASDGQFVMRKELWSSLGGFKPWRCNSDTDFLFRMQFMGFKEYGILEVLYQRRIHPGSLTQCRETGYDSEMRRAVREIMNRERNARTTKEECRVEPVVGRLADAEGCTLPEL